MSAKSNTTSQEAAIRLRRFYRLAIILVVAVALLGLLFFSAPRYVVRHLLTSELDERGITYEGLETLSINPWTRELWLGPVRFGFGPSERGQIGKLGFILRFNSLLQSRISVEQLLVRGIDVIVTRNKDDALALNGIPLERFVPLPDAAAQPVAEDEPWDVGADTIELRDSRLIFRNGDQGDLQVDVERLTLKEFQTWEPERPGRFELNARVNDIQLNWSGEARPFADNITLAIDSRTEQADVPKVVRFTGPWGLDRRDGTYDAQLKYELTLFHSGRLEGHTVGIVDIKGADYLREGVFALALEQAKLDLDIHYTLSESGEFTLKGQLATDFGRSGFELADKTRLSVAAGRVAVGELDTVFAKDGKLSVVLRPEIELEDVAFSGPIEISVDKLLELLALLQGLSTADTVSTKDTGLGDFADRSVSVPSSDVKIGRLSSKGDTFSLQSSQGQVELGLKTRTDLHSVQIDVSERHINIERLQSVLERLNVKSGQGRLALEMMGGNSLMAGTAGGELGELRIGTLDAKVNELGLQVRTGAVSLQLAAVSRATGFSGLIYGQATLPEMQIDLGAADATLSRSSLDAQGGTRRWKAAGDALVEALAIEFAKGKQGSLKSKRIEIKALQVDEQLLLAADALTVDGADLYAKRSLFADLNREGDAASEKASPKPSVAPPTPVPAAREVDVSKVQTLLVKLGYEPGPVDGRMGRRTAAAITEFQRREKLSMDGQPSIELFAALQARVAASGDGDPVPVSPPSVDKSQGFALYLGQVALTGNPVLRFRDDMVTPHVTLDTVFRKAEVRNLDTRKTGKRTDLSVVADVNESTRVELTGWLSGMGETSDIEVEAKVEDLQLSTYSPYIAGLGGMHIESGQLDAASSATAKQGVIEGNIQLGIDNMSFRPLSKEDAERVSNKIGVPLDTAVSLLQDNSGHIALALPVSGMLSKPKVDFSSAVNKAIGGVLVQVFPPSIVASMVQGVTRGADPSFESIEFTPGSTELGEAGKRNLDAVAKLLAEHPKVSLKVCGRSTARDMKQSVTETRTVKQVVAGEETQAAPSTAGPVEDSGEESQALSELAQVRMRVVRRYLIQERGAGLKQVSECGSTFDAADQGNPHVEIML